MNKVTIEQIEGKIVEESYLVLPDGRTTLCTITLQNGFTIQGLSACVDISNFDLKIGRKWAREDAIKKIWPLEGYLLAQRIYEQPLQNKILDETWSSVQKVIDTLEGKNPKKNSRKGWTDERRRKMSELATQRWAKRRDEAVSKGQA
jgi:hypothetical protein